MWCQIQPSKTFPIHERPGELDIPVDIGEGRGEAKRGAQRAGRLAVDDVQELLVAQAISVTEARLQFLLSKAKRLLARAGIAMTSGA
jgi:hypothetical protein